jgi:hypothetical protein
MGILFYSTGDIRRRYSTGKVILPFLSRNQELQRFVDSRFAACCVRNGIHFVLVFDFVFDFDFNSVCSEWPAAGINE